VTRLSARVATSLFAAAICLAQWGQSAGPAADTAAGGAAAAPRPAFAAPATSIDLRGIQDPDPRVDADTTVVTFGARGKTAKRGLKIADADVGVPAAP
jgi:hypothetical protein